MTSRQNTRPAVMSIPYRLVKPPASTAVSTYPPEASAPTAKTAAGRIVRMLIAMVRLYHGSVSLGQMGSGAAQRLVRAKYRARAWRANVMDCDRPFQVLFAGRFADALVGQVRDRNQAYCL